MSLLFLSLLFVSLLFVAVIGKKAAVVILTDGEASDGDIVGKKNRTVILYWSLLPSFIYRLLLLLLMYYNMLVTIVIRLR